LDYYTSGGTAGCPALLVEPSAANGILNSQDTATSWLLGASLTSGYVDVIGVSGNNLTVAVSGSNIGGVAGRMQRANNNVALASGSTYTISFLMKKTGSHTIGGYYALITGGAAGDLGGGFNVSGSFSSGQIYNSAGTTNRIRRVEQWGTDVYRCSETFTMTASGTLTTFSAGPTVSVTSDTNSASGTTIAFAAPQIELGAVPTTFIPTTAAAVTRNADVITLSGAVSGCIGQTEGTIYAEVDYRNLSTGNQAILQLFQDSSNRFGLATFRTGSDNLFQFYCLTGGSTTVNINAIRTAGVYKLAGSYANNNWVFYINGTQIGTDTSSAVPTATTVEIGNAAGTTQFNNRIRAAALYTTRLTDSELAALTTL
jgi:hypothetical protein